MLRSLWSRLRKVEDPYEDFYLQSPAADPRNLIVTRIRDAPEGSVFAVKTETHPPEIMSQQIKDLGSFFGADLVRIVPTHGLGLEPAATAETDGLAPANDLPFAVLMLFHAEHDHRDSPGIGGHAADLKAAFATFQTAAIIREYGFQARRMSPADPDKVASSAGLGSLDGRGRLKTPAFGSKVHVADVIVTDLPLAPDS